MVSFYSTLGNNVFLFLFSFFLLFFFFFYCLFVVVVLFFLFSAKRFYCVVVILPYMYIYIYVCVCMYIYMYTYVCVCICIWSYKYNYIYIYSFLSLGQGCYILESKSPMFPTFQTCCSHCSLVCHSVLLLISATHCWSQFFFASLSKLSCVLIWTNPKCVDFVPVFGLPKDTRTSLLRVAPYLLLYQT